ncbi:hypothetical protein [Raineyella sp. LH-20]|uniref:hypothetical protein n=1 Tax=Raineyella sp. LH-20 TaxID=3081204 RepID=UPI0029558D71|nr:hypothetical protein [Raineyella sp. LH-20]WOP18436.1 hypothetical protein R0146_14630 [Raineyella sp. LH-20]
MSEFLWVIGGLAVVVIVDRLALRAEARGWIYWRRARGRAIANAAMGGLTEALQPSQIHYVQEMKQDRKTSAARGQGPEIEDAPSQVPGAAIETPQVMMDASMVTTGAWADGPRVAIHRDHGADA